MWADTLLTMIAKGAGALWKSANAEKERRKASEAAAEHHMRLWNRLTQDEKDVLREFVATQERCKWRVERHPSIDSLVRKEVLAPVGGEVAAWDTQCQYEVCDVDFWEFLLKAWAAHQSVTQTPGGP